MSILALAPPPNLTTSAIGNMHRASRPHRPLGRAYDTDRIYIV